MPKNDHLQNTRVDEMRQSQKDRLIFAHQQLEGQQRSSSHGKSRSCHREVFPLRRLAVLIDDTTLVSLCIDGRTKAHVRTVTRMNHRAPGNETRALKIKGFFVLRLLHADFNVIP
jgi:hypothetical protein